MFYLVGQSEDFKPGRQDSQTALRDCSQEVREEPGYTGVFAAKTRQSEHQKITVNWGLPWWRSG